MYINDESQKFWSQEAVKKILDEMKKGLETYKIESQKDYDEYTFKDLDTRRNRLKLIKEVDELYDSLSNNNFTILPETLINHLKTIQNKIENTNFVNYAPQILIDCAPSIYGKNRFYNLLETTINSIYKLNEYDEKLNKIIEENTMRMNMLIENIDVLQHDNFQKKLLIEEKDKKILNLETTIFNLNNKVLSLESNKIVSDSKISTLENQMSEVMNLLKNTDFSEIKKSKAPTNKFF